MDRTVMNVPIASPRISNAFTEWHSFHDMPLIAAISLFDVVARSHPWERSLWTTST